MLDQVQRRESKEDSHYTKQDYRYDYGKSDKKLVKEGNIFTLKEKNPTNVGNWWE